MKTVPLFEVLHLVQNTDKEASIMDILIQDQVAKGLEALERTLLDDFARAEGHFSSEARQDWRNSPDASGIRERIRHYIQRLGGN